MENEIKVIKVWLDKDSIFIETDKGEIKNHPISWFPRLLKATKAQREDFTLSPFGIHWEKLDEDLSFEGFLHLNKKWLFENIYKRHFENFRHFKKH